MITTDLRLNQPRFAALPDIIKAKSKPMDIKSISDFHCAPRTEHQTIEHYQTPPARVAGTTLKDTDALLRVLKEHEVIS